MDTTLDPTHYLRALADPDTQPLADWYGSQLDRAVEQTRARLEAPTALAEAAHWYAARGLRVFPVTPNGKTPLPASLHCCGESHRRGCLDAVTDVSWVAGWWRAHPSANVGLATGWRFDVIDQDGPGSWRAWLDGTDWPAVVGVVSTPRPGGVHRYVRALGLRNGQNIAPGIDYRGRGGYVLAPPSVVNGARYSWLQPLAV